MANIGIKLADGSFYPVLEESSRARRAMVVTTVQDKQPSVRINLYKESDTAEADDLVFVGALEVDKLPVQKRGEPDIRLEMDIDESGQLHIQAIEQSSGRRSVKSFDLDVLGAMEEDAAESDFQISALEDTSTEEEPPVTLVTEFPEANGLDDTDTIGDFSMEDTLADDFELELPETSEDIDTSFDLELEEEAFPEPTELSAADTGTDTFDLEMPLDESLPEPETDADIEDITISAADGLDTTPYNDAADSSRPADKTDDFALPEDDFSMPDDDFSLSDDDFSISAEEQAKTEERSEPDFSMDDFGLDEADQEAPVESEPEAVSRGMPPSGSLMDRAERYRPDEESGPEPDERVRPNLPLWLRIVISVVVVAVLIGLSFLVFKCVNDRTPALPEGATAALDKPLVTSTEAPPTIPQPVATPQLAPAQAAPAQAAPAASTSPATTTSSAANQTGGTAESTAPASTSSDGDTPPDENRGPGVWHKVRWGDTLWDLSISYYRTPWQYLAIFYANPTRIRHPNLIVAGAWIFIPK